MRLTRLDPRGAKRTKPRIEELTKLSVHGIITIKPDAIHTVKDAEGFRLDFVDEVFNGQWRLVVYQNGLLTSIAYPIVEKPIGGRIKNHRNWRSDCQYYILVNGRRYSHLYVDKKNKKIGTRHCLGAVYTIDSLSPKEKPFWRAYRKIQKKAERQEHQ
jgi:hypothetical protein